MAMILFIGNFQNGRTNIDKQICFKVYGEAKTQNIFLLSLLTVDNALETAKNKVIYHLVIIHTGIPAGRNRSRL